MFKFFKIIVFIIIINIPHDARSHVEHYDDLNFIEFDIYRNNKNNIGHQWKIESIGVQNKLNFSCAQLNSSFKNSNFIANSHSKFKSKYQSESPIQIPIPN